MIAGIVQEWNLGFGSGDDCIDDMNIRSRMYLDRRFAKVGIRQSIGSAWDRKRTTGCSRLCLEQSETNPSKRGSICFVICSQSSHQRIAACTIKSDRRRNHAGLVCNSLSRSGPTAADSQVLVSLYKFSRPHTMMGTFISVLSVSFLALHPFSLSVYTAKVMMQALVPALLMNICIVGLNQVCGDGN